VWGEAINRQYSGGVQSGSCWLSKCTTLLVGEGRSYGEILPSAFERRMVGGWRFRWCEEIWSGAQIFMGPLILA
jgi:hypothetical protein